MDSEKRVKRLTDLSYAFALRNAIEHNYRANPGSVIGKLIATNPEIKKDMKIIAKLVHEIVNEINSKSKEEIDELFHQYKKHLPKQQNKDKEKKGLKELDGVDKEKGVVMRFAPSPSGPMHLGHAITGGLTSLYVKKYGGEFILRIEDTNPENIYEPAYKMIVDEAQWLFGNVTKVIIQSERMEIYYSYIEKLIKLGYAYVCTCPKDKFKEYVKNQQDCPCRNLSIEEHLKRWKKMLDKNGYQPGEAVVRFKSGMTNKNPALRDFPLARINLNVHPKQGKKYRVWPLMNLSVTVDDIELGMTHIIRAKDHEDNARKQYMIYKALGLEKRFPKTYFSGRLKFKDMELSSTKTRKKIEQGIYEGWDDPRLPFIASFRKRGYKAEAFLKLTKSIGLTPVDKVFDKKSFFKLLNHFNKEIIDPIAKRFFFVYNPMPIKIINAKKQEIELDLHPDNYKGGRKFKTKDEFYITSEDYHEIKKQGYLHRLMDCLNFYFKDDKFYFYSTDYEDFVNAKKFGFKRGKIIHWLPKQEQLLHIRVIGTDENMEKIIEYTGLGEPTIKEHVKIGDIIQFERFGFAKLDKVVEHEENDNNQKEYLFYYTHR